MSILLLKRSTNAFVMSSRRFLKFLICQWFANPAHLCAWIINTSIACFSGRRSGKHHRISLHYCIKNLLIFFSSSFQSLSQQIMPQAWKISLIIPIPKVSLPSLREIRPISLLSLPAKLLECLIFKKKLSLVCWMLMVRVNLNSELKDQLHVS